MIATENHLYVQINLQILIYEDIKYAFMVMIYNKYSPCSVSEYGQHYKTTQRYTK